MNNEIVLIKKNGKIIEREIDHVRNAEIKNKVSSLMKKDLDDYFTEVRIPDKMPS